MNLKFKTLYFEITHGCNQSCKHCYLDGGTHHEIMDLSIEQIKKVLFEFKQQGGEYVIITGGEPTVRSDLYDILDYLDSLNIPFELASNCLLLNGDKLNKLLTYRNLDLIFTSLLGCTREQHYSISGKDTFGHVLNCLNFFDKHKIKTYVQITLAKDYINDAMIIADKLSKLELCKIKITPIADVGVKKDDKLKEKLILQESDYIKFLAILQEIKKKYKSKIEESNLLTKDQLKETIDDYVDSDLYSLKYLYLCIRPNGLKSFSFSVNNPYTFGNVLDGILIENNEMLRNYILLLRGIDEELLTYASDKIAINYDYLVDEKINKH